MTDHPEGLGSRGLRMWQDSVALWQLTPAHAVLLEEACRIADRLDVLDHIIRRWNEPSGDDEEGSGGITGLLAESRQQSTALRGLVAEIRQGQKGVAPASSASDTAGGAGVSDLTKRIAERRREAEG